MDNLKKILIKEILQDFNFKINLEFSDCFEIDDNPKNMEFYFLFRGLR